MAHWIVFAFGFSVSMISFPSTLAKGAERPGWQAGCDIPKGDFRSVARTDAKGCEQACRKEPKCQAAVHVSGWRKCFLKSVTKPQFAITFFSGAKQGNIQKNHDAKGKDLKRHAPVKTAQQCQTHCQQNDGCLSFTFIDGYSVCWLKSEKLVAYPKQFSCWMKPNGVDSVR